MPLLFAFDFHGVKLSESPAMGKEIPGDPRSVLSAKTLRLEIEFIPAPESETQYFNRVMNKASASATRTMMDQGRPSARKVIAWTT